MAFFEEKEAGSSECNTHYVTTTEHPQVHSQIYVISREERVYEEEAESMSEDH